MFVRRTLTVLLGLLLLATTVVAVAAAPGDSAGDDSRIVGDHDERRAEPKAFARLSPGKESELVFYEMIGERGDSRGIGVSIYVPAGELHPVYVSHLRGTNPLELHYALSEEGTETPGILREYYKNRFQFLSQGWAISKLKPPFYNNLFSCKTSEQSIVNAVSSTGLQYSYNELSEGPHNGPFWYPEDPNALFPSYYKNNGIVTVGDAYYHLMLCEEDPGFVNTIINVQLEYTEMDGYDALSSGQLNWQLFNPGDQMSFLSWPFDSDLSGDNNWYWMLTVEDVHYQDSLHVGMAWS